MMRRLAVALVAPLRGSRMLTVGGMASPRCKQALRLTASNSQATAKV